MDGARRERGDGLSDPLCVERQYRDGSRLRARTDLYARFGGSEEPWYRWLYARLAVSSGERVLDAGCGTGGVWDANRERVPAEVTLVLLDRSAGMLAEARSRLAGLSLHALTADLRALPLPQASFDLVTANHVLYHVDDPAAAIDELARVVRPGGRLAVATNVRGHLQELRALAGRHGLAVGALADDPPGAFVGPVVLEAMERRFGSVRAEPRRQVLRVTEAEPVGSYLRSILPADAATDARLASLLADLTDRITTRGPFPLTAHTTLFLNFGDGPTS